MVKEDVPVKRGWVIKYQSPEAVKARGSGPDAVVLSRNMWYLGIKLLHVVGFI